MARGKLDTGRAEWRGLDDQNTPRPGRRKADEPSRKKPGRAACRMNYHARVLVLQNDVKEWRGASVAEALTRTIDGHTR